MTQGLERDTKTGCLDTREAREPRTQTTSAMSSDGSIRDLRSMRSVSRAAMPAAMRWMEDPTWLMNFFTFGIDAAP